MNKILATPPGMPSAILADTCDWSQQITEGALATSFAAHRKDPAKWLLPTIAAGAAGSGGGHPFRNPKSVPGDIEEWTASLFYDFRRLKERYPDDNSPQAGAGSFPF